MSRHGTLSWMALLGLALLPGCTLTSGSVSRREIDPPPESPPPAERSTPYPLVAPPPLPVPQEKIARRTEPPELPAATVRPSAPAEGEEVSRARPAAPPLPEPAPADAPVVHGLRAYLEKRPDRAAVALQSYDRRRQEMLLTVLPFLARVAEQGPTSLTPEEAAEQVRRLRQLESELADRAALQIEDLRLCKHIAGFGQFVPVEEGHEFEAGGGAGEGEPFHIYVELANLSRRRRGAVHETWVAGRLEILDAQGTPVFAKGLRPQVDHSLSPRHDYFIRIDFAIPGRLPPGSYTLRIEIKDVTAVPGLNSSGVSPEALQVPPHRTAVRTCDFKVRLPRSPRPDGGPRAAR